MPLATEIGSRLAALREDFVKATANEKPSAEDLEKAQNMHVDLASIEKEYSRARQLDEAAEQTKAAIEAEKKQAEEDEQLVTTVPFGGNGNANGTKNGGSFDTTAMKSEVFQKWLASLQP